MLEHVDAAHPGQADIEEHDVPVGEVVVEPRQHGLRLARDLDLVAVGAELARDRPGDVVVVLDDHHLERRALRSSAQR